jgi:2-keto-4-pentenoate hydratase/2-oxohepta-3-ene-1,7-dioic acid hydratase in catechol pathway
VGYRHRYTDARDCPWPPGKIVCVGRNYAAHARELNNPLPEHPILFIKPGSCAVAMEQPLVLPAGRDDCHHELEIALLIGRPLAAARAGETLAAIAGIGLGLDLTLRDEQQRLKAQGHPWERAKAFDGAAPLSAFHGGVPAALDRLELALHINGRVVQAGNSRDMLFSIPALLEEISHAFSLQPGDVVLTGTPAGVGPLRSGDTLCATLAGILRVETRVL